MAAISLHAYPLGDSLELTLRTLEETRERAEVARGEVAELAVPFGPQVAVENLRDPVMNLDIRVHAPLQLVCRNLLGTWVLLLLKNRHSKIVVHLDGGVIQGYVLPEYLGNSRLLKDRLPWALRLARTAIYAPRRDGCRADLEIVLCRCQCIRRCSQRDKH